MLLLTVEVIVSLAVTEAVVVRAEPSVFFTGQDCLLMLAIEDGVLAAACLRHRWSQLRLLRPMGEALRAAGSLTPAQVRSIICELFG